MRRQGARRRRGQPMSAWVWRSVLGSVALAAVVWCVVLWGPWAGRDGTEIRVAGGTAPGGEAAVEGFAGTQAGLGPSAAPSGSRLAVASGSDGRVWLEAGSVLRGEDGGERGQSGGDVLGGVEGSAGGSDDSEGVMWARRVVAGSGCAGLFSAPGELLTLTAGGFAGGATASLTGHAVSLGGTTVSAPVLADATADADGVLEVTWSVPSAPAATTDAAPRGYAVVASGLNPAGGTHTARLVSPVVAYPGATPCAVDDSSSTALGQAVQVAVLANDVAPFGGSLDKTTVTARAAVGGVFSTETVTGMVTFTPDPGFWGTVQTTYAVYDGWGIGVQAALSVSVDAGCTVTGSTGVELIEGTAGDDVICVPDRDDRHAFHVIDAKGGDDVVLGGAGVEWVYGGDGDDVIFGNGGDDRIVAGAGIDTVHGGPGMDSVYSVDLADTVIDDGYELVVSPSVTVAQSGPVSADDWVWVDVSGTVEIDVLGNDHDPNEDLDPATLRVSAVPSSGTAEVAQDAQGRAVVEFTAGAVGGSVSFSYEACDSLGACAEADVTVMVGTSDCTIIGTKGDDMLRGTPGDDVICGLGGNDHIVGLGGDDVIVGGPGHDLVYADDPADGSVGGDDIVWGGQGHDTLLGGGGADRMWGGPGDDSVYGESGGDALVGGPGADTVSGGFGDDRLWGNAGGDKLYGFEDDDAVWGGAGADVVWGGPGDDVLWGGADDDELRGGPGADRIRAGPGDDEAAGQAGADAIWGGPGDDVLRGGPGDDEIHGGPGEDTLHGDADDDRLWGGIDADTLDGGLGADHLDGGAGADACRRADTKVGCERA